MNNRGELNNNEVTPIEAQNEVVIDADSERVKTPEPNNEKEMEVHHHPHVEKKSFKEYLLEGLMIFIAVTMGFFAETIREKMTEHERAEVYAGSLQKDLQADTALLSSCITYTAFAANTTDTLMHLLSTTDPKNIPSGELYWYGLFGAAHTFFIPNDATFQQIKSSASLQYFNNNALVKQIANYDQLCRKWQQLANSDEAIYVEVRKARAKIFQFAYNLKANDISGNGKVALINWPALDSFKHANPPLLSYDKTDFNEYVELVRSRFFRRSLIVLDSLHSEAANLIKSLKKDYPNGENE